MNCRKVSRMRDPGSLGRISSLPDELLGYILSFLPTLSAVQTSVLSTRWRYLFTLTTNLSFEDEERHHSHDHQALNNRFERFVNGTLALHRVTSIQKFSLKVKHKCEYDHSRILVWITAAILKEVKHLHLYFSYQQISLPNCIFSSQSLVVLEIILSREELELKVPRIVCLPNLGFLKFKNATFSDAESSTRFFVGCPQLKELVLIKCDLGTDHVRFSALALEKLSVSYCRGHVEINAPNLARLSYVCRSHEDMMLLKKPCSPSRVDVDFSNYEFSVLGLLTVTHTARELVLTGHTLEVLTRVDFTRIPVYSKLESLNLGFCRYDTWKCVTYWLANSPQLKTVIFVQGLLDRGLYRIDHNDHNQHPSLELVPFSSNVETIKVREFGGRQTEMLLLKYLLENAGSLKRLILDLASVGRLTRNIEEELRICKELLMLPKASTSCTIELVYSNM